MKKKILSLLVVAAMAVSSGAVFADVSEQTDNSVDSDAVAVTETAEEVEVSEEAEATEATDAAEDAVVSTEDADAAEAEETAEEPEVSAEETAETEAAEVQKQVKVFVDDTVILFDDQQPLIKDDFTLVPARGVFEAMNNKVSWDGENRVVTINSENNITRIVLTIDSNTMTVYHFTSIMNADATDITLEVAPQIINDRTMIPLRAISEALGTTVNWDGENYEVHIVTETADAATDTDAEEVKKLTVSLTADKTEVKEGEDVTLSMNVSNLSLYPDTFVSGITVSVSYDKDNFELKKVYLCGADGNEVNGAMGADNAEYTEDSLKAAYVTIDAESALKEDGAALKLVFTAKNTAESSFALVNRYNSKLGNDMTILLGSVNGEENKTIEGKKLVIDTIPVVVNAETKEEAADEKEETEVDADADTKTDADVDVETDAETETDADTEETAETVDADSEEITEENQDEASEVTDEEAE